MDRPIERILAQLGEHKFDGKYYTARCPAHNDKSPSLRVFEGTDGAACFYCASQKCSTAQIMTALGLQPSDRYPQENPRARPRRPEKRRFNFQGGPVDGELETVYPYVDLAGRPQYEVCRWRLPATADGKPQKTFTQRRKLSNGDLVVSLKAGHYVLKRRVWVLASSDPDAIPAEEPNRWFDEPSWVLYRLPEVAMAITVGADVWLTEGEKDADRLRREGVTATCNAMGAGSWKLDYTHQLAGAGRVVMVVDRDKAGYKHALAVRQALAHAEIGELVFVTAASGKDAHDHLSEGLGLDDFAPCEPERELEKLEAAPEHEEEPTEPQAVAPAAGQAREAKRTKKGKDGPPDADEPVELPPLPDGWKQPTSDLDNFDLFLERAGDDIRYCSLMGRFLSWDTTRWKIDTTGGAILLDHWQPLARTIEDMAPKAAAHANNDGLKKLILKHKSHCLSSGGFSALAGFVQKSSRLAVEPDALDQHPDLLPCRNLTLDLRTGKPVANARALLMTKRVEVAYDDRAECPTWEQCLHQWTAGDADMQRFLWKMAGYWLTGHTRERKFFFFVGPSGTGKTTFVGTLQRLMGDYAVVLNKREVMERKTDSVPENIAELKGRRLSITAEVDSSDKFDEGLMLQLSGQDKVRARYMRQDGFEFEATHKMAMFGNSRPAIYSQGDAMWDRIVPVPFEQQMIGEGRDNSLNAKLAAELPGILAWAVAGAVCWYAEGLDAPGLVSARLTEYREDMDTLGQFLAAATSPDQGGHVSARGLYNAYRQWARETGEHRPFTETRFGIKMGDRPDVKRGFDSKKRRIYLDILINAEYFETGQVTGP